MKKSLYPAFFHKAEESGFWLSFPDLPECFTQVDNMTECYEMAVEALGLALECREKEHDIIPAASYPSEIAVDKDTFLAVIEFDMLTYKKRTSSRAVKKHSVYLNG